MFNSQFIYRSIQNSMLEKTLYLMSAWKWKMNCKNFRTRSDWGVSGYQNSQRAAQLIHGAFSRTGRANYLADPARPDQIHFWKLASTQTFHDLTVGIHTDFNEKTRRIEANFFHALYKTMCLQYFAPIIIFSIHLENVNNFRLENRPKLSDIKQFKFF